MDLGRLLAELLRDGGRVDVRLDGYHIVVKPDSHLDRPAAAPPPGPKSAEPWGLAGDILAVLREAGRPATGKQVVEALAKKGKDHGEAKVKYSLACLVEAGLLDADCPGYAVRPRE